MKEIKDIKEIQKRALNILIYIDGICKEHNIKYSLAGGTLLGAIRHKGFIPWDDDIDILMTRPEYERFLKIMDNTQSNKFKCLHYGKNFPNYAYRFAKVVDLTTTLTEWDYVQHKEMGIFVDVFPVDGIEILKKDKIYKKVKFYAQMLSVSGQKNYHKSKLGLSVSIMKFFGYIIAKLMGWKYWLKKHEKLVSKYKFEEYNKCTVYSGVYGKKEILDKKIYEELIFSSFENIEFPILKHYDTYLTTLYGDYMTPPPKDKQIAHHIVKIYKK